MSDDIVSRACRRTRRLLAAVITTTAAVTAAVVMTVAHLQDAEPDAPKAQGGVSTPAPPIPDSPAGPPADLRWRNTAGVSLPVSEQAGPRDTSAGLARGFAHDQAGAVLAAVHILVRVAPNVGASVFDPTLRSQVVGPDAPALRERVAREYDELRGQAGMAYGQPVGRLYAILRGYQLISYDPAAVTLQVLTEVDAGQPAPLLTASQVQLSWTGTDWALVAPPGGSFDTVVTTVADPAGFESLTPNR
jgi:hypothetical protein